MPTISDDRHEPEALSDEQVVARVLAGDAPLFELLIRRHNQRLYRVARSVLRNDTEAEDVMQEAYVQAYTHLDQFAGRASFATWLARIAFYEALARLKRRRREAVAERPMESEDVVMSADKSESPSPEHEAYRGELRALLEAAVDRLPATHRVAFVLREIEGMSTQEAAECLGIREDALKQRLHRAKALLRDRLYQSAGIASGAAFAFHRSRCDRMVQAVFERLRIRRGDAVLH